MEETIISLAFIGYALSFGFSSLANTDLLILLFDGLLEDLLEFGSVYLRFVMIPVLTTNRLRRVSS